MSHADTIREYYAAWVRDDVAAVMALCTDDVVAGIMPGKDLLGKQAVVQFLDKFAKGMTDKRYDIHAIAIEDDVGMLEGIENYIKDGKPISLPFMTVFRFRDGKICSWRDYFDMATLLKQLQA
ncbi:MAG: limonene,2-epoxide hydrolase [Pseudomonadota bacterium]|jgi:limonene-1,2-epoxide hydrolase